MNLDIQNLSLESLEDLETPLSNDFWEGVAIGVTIAGGVIAVIALT